MQLMTQAEYARHRGVSRQAVNRAVGKGKIIPVHDEKGVKKIDVSEADRALGLNVVRVLARCTEVVLRALGRLGGRADEMAALCAKDGVLGARVCFETIERDLRKMVVDELAKLAAGEPAVDGLDAESEPP